MAEVFLSPLLQVCFDKLSDPILRFAGRMWGLQKEMNRLQSTLSMIRAVLEDAEERQVEDKAARIWLTKLKDVAQDADDLLEELLAGVQEREIRDRDRQGFQVRYLEAFQFSGTFTKGHKLKQIQDALDLITAERFNFHLREGIVVKRHDTGRRKQTGSFFIESEVYGREKDKEEIVKMLLVGTNTITPGDVSIVPIVGIGGLGKTTLARLAYNDERVKRQFELKMWVCVTDDFDVQRIIKAIIESATKNKCDFSEMDVLQSQLQESLCGKRYLLVLDDVWNEDQDEWDELKTLLRGGVEGSKIIVTTRSKKVAVIMGTTSPHHLQGLSEDDCWALFKQRAFSQGEENQHPNLLPIGKQIVKKCVGVPLVAKTLGSLMRFKREEREWLLVQESELWDVCERENGILPALRLSYNHLPLYLKPCFAYCSMFPKNYEIKKEKLIHQWMAQGFIISSGTSKKLEDIGNEYFNDLLGMSFFQDVKKCDNGSITECKMHDIIHDLATSIAGNEFMILEHGREPSNLARTRHSSVICDFKSPIIPEVLYAAKKLRTLLLLFPRGDFREAPPNMFSSFRYLRVLDLSGCGIEFLPASISSLTCLRYLDLSNNYIQRLPEDLSKLRNLQILNLLGCYNLVELPRTMRVMRSLRHLNIKGCEMLTCMPAGIGKLVELQTLPIFIVGEEAEESIEELQHLNLRGELEVKHLENVRNTREAKKANLKEKQHIHLLGLSWGQDNVGLNVRKNVSEVTFFRMKERQSLHSSGPSKGPDSRSGENAEDLIECLQPHSNLRRLFLKGYVGSRFPCWMGDNLLPNLIEIVLIDCKRCEHLPGLGHLPFLEVLYMHGMDAVKRIHFEFYGLNIYRPFLSLKELTLKDFPNLENWLCMDGKEAFPCLGKLTINKCPKLTTMPRFPSLQYLELRNCNAKILRSVANLTSLFTLVIDVVPELLSLPKGLLQNNSLLMSLTISSCPKLQSLSWELGKLVALKSLTIRWCEELTSLPQELRNLSSLESLEISECHNLISLPEEGIQGLSSLRSLSVENCNNLTSLPMEMQHLTALEHLMIMYCPNLASLPDSLQHLTTLRSLNILSCPELASLPEGLQHVTTLQNLEIRSCPNLTALPEWVENLISLRSLAISDCHNLTSLPDGLQGLSVLQHLSVQECPNLERQCKRGTGQDWHKIAHIPHVYIGSPGLGKHDIASSSSS